VYSLPLALPVRDRGGDLDLLRLADLDLEPLCDLERLREPERLLDRDRDSLCDREPDGLLERDPVGLRLPERDLEPLLDRDRDRELSLEGVAERDLDCECDSLLLVACAFFPVSKRGSRTLPDCLVSCIISSTTRTLPYSGFRDMSNTPSSSEYCWRRRRRITIATITVAKNATPRISPRVSPKSVPVRFVTPPGNLAGGVTGQPLAQVQYNADALAVRIPEPSVEII